jgi:hypothetical protein
MTKWFCGSWYLSHTTEECYQRALANLNKFNFVFLTESLSSDLPLVAKLLRLNVTENDEQVRVSSVLFIFFDYLSLSRQVTAYNIRMHDPLLSSSHSPSDSTNITDLSSIPEFSQSDGTYEIAVRMNQYDFKLYRHAIFRNCVTLKKAPLVAQDCREFAKNLPFQF